MAIYYSPAGNPEVWEAKPDWYITQDEWKAAHPVEENTRVATTDELFSILRSVRDVTLRDEYDPRIAQLIRQQRLASTDEERAAIAATIALWDAYAVALCDLPEQDGAPWADGDIPWPTPPEA